MAPKDPTPPLKKHYLNLELSPDEYTALTNLAKDDGRSRSNYALIVLRRHFLEKVAGTVPPPPKNLRA